MTFLSTYAAAVMGNNGRQRPQQQQVMPPDRLDIISACACWAAGRLHQSSACRSGLWVLLAWCCVLELKPWAACELVAVAVLQDGWRFVMFLYIVYLSPHMYGGGWLRLG